MHIKKILEQHRRDFKAIYICEHCEREYKSSGYDDDNFHVNVIPGIPCPKCGEVAGENYRPLKTKYDEDYQI